MAVVTRPRRKLFLADDEKAPVVAPPHARKGGIAVLCHVIRSLFVFSGGRPFGSVRQQKLAKVDAHKAPGAYSPGFGSIAQR